MFASLVIEREPLELQHLPAALLLWLRDAGMVAAFCLLIWAIAFAIQRPAWARGRAWSARSALFALLAGTAAGMYAVFFLLLFTQGLPPLPLAVPGRPTPPPETIYTPAQNLVLTAAGACA